MSLSRSVPCTGRPARGQALIEFAIVLLVLMALIVGGIELGTAALNSRALRDGVQVAGDEWSQAVQRYAVSYQAGSAPVLSVRLAASDAAPTPGLCGLGNHEPGGFDFPSCDNLACENPDTGLPDFQSGVDPEACNPANSASANAPYRLDADLHLFNPLPLDVSACLSGAALDGLCVNRLFDALPALHRALRSVYQLRCVDTLTGLNEVACGPGVVWLMRLPGRLDPVDKVVRLAQAEAVGDVVSRSGEPLDAFQLQCQPAGRNGFAGCDRQDPEACACDSRDDPQNICWAPVTGQALACEARVIVRYRHAFLSAFPTGRFAGQAVSGALLAELDLGIGGLGGLGSEVFAQGGASNPSYFKVPWRTFQGCVETLTLASAAASSVDTRRVACN